MTNISNINYTNPNPFLRKPTTTSLDYSTCNKNERKKDKKSSKKVNEKASNGNLGSLKSDKHRIQGAGLTHKIEWSPKTKYNFTHSKDAIFAKYNPSNMENFNEENKQVRAIYPSFYKKICDFNHTNRDGFGLHERKLSLSSDNDKLDQVNGTGNGSLEKANSMRNILYQNPRKSKAALTVNINAITNVDNDKMLTSGNNTNNDNESSNSFNIKSLLFNNSNKKLNTNYIDSTNITLPNNTTNPVIPLSHQHTQRTSTSRKETQRKKSLLYKEFKERNAQSVNTKYLSMTKNISKIENTNEQGLSKGFLTKRTFGLTSFLNKKLSSKLKLKGNDNNYINVQERRMNEVSLIYESLNTNTNNNSNGARTEERIKDFFLKYKPEIADKLKLNINP